MVELSELTEVRQAISKPWEALARLKETLWSGVAIRIREALDDLLIDMRSLPKRTRQYDAYTSVYDTIKLYLSGHGTLSDMKTDSLKDRHWKRVLQKLNIRVPYVEITLGMLWDNGVLDRKKGLSEILSVAQGEMPTIHELDLVLYQNRVRLIRICSLGWMITLGVLFGCEVHLTTEP